MFEKLNSQPETRALVRRRLDRQYGAGAFDELIPYLETQMAQKTPPLAVRMVCQTVWIIIDKARTDLAEIQAVHDSLCPK